MTQITLYLNNNTIENNFDFFRAFYTPSNELNVGNGTHQCWVTKTIWKALIANKVHAPQGYAIEETGQIMGRFNGQKAHGGYQVSFFFNAYAISIINNQS